MRIRNLLLYSFVVAVFIAFKFIAHLTPTLEYFKSRDAYDIALDASFFLIVWLAVFCFSLLLSYFIKKDRTRRIIFCLILTSAFIFLLLNLKEDILAFLYKYTQTELYRNLKEFYFSLFPFPEEENAKKFFKIILVVFGAGFSALGIYLSVKISPKRAKNLLTVGAFISFFIVLNLFRYHNERFINPIIDVSLANKIIEPVILRAGESKLPSSIHIILFDGLPYDSGIFKNKNFSKLVSESYIFHNAISAGKESLSSIPQMLTGQSGQVLPQGDRLLIKTDKEIVSVSKDNIFSLARSYGDNVFITGFFHEYCHLFKNFTDGCSDYSVYATYTSFVHRGLFNELVDRWRILETSWLSIFGIENINLAQKVAVIYDGKEEHNPYLWAALFKNLVSDYQKFMKENNEPALFFTHLNSPHAPFVFDDSGNLLFRDSAYTVMPLPLRENYEQEMRYLDSVLGVFLEDIKNSSDYEKSMIIIASDHSLKQLPDFSGEITHVPLIIKAPFQKERVDIYEEFLLVSFPKIIEGYYSSAGQKDFISSILPR